MSRYIDADVLIDDLIHNRSFYPALVASAIKNTPTADVVEVRHGHWEKTLAYSYNWDDFHNLKCSECGISIGETALREKDYKYCPNCGAKMDGERSENNG